MSAYTSAATLQVRRQIFLGKCPAAFRPRRADVVELMVVWSGLSKGRCPEHVLLQQAIFSWPRLSVPFAPDFDCRRRPGRQNSASIRTPTVGEASCVAANRRFLYLTQYAEGTCRTETLYGTVEISEEIPIYRGSKSRRGEIPGLVMDTVLARVYKWGK